MRSVTIQVRLTPDQKTVLSSAAEAEGLSLSSWVRQTLIRQARRVERDQAIQQVAPVQGDHEGASVGLDLTVTHYRPDEGD